MDGPRWPTLPTVTRTFVRITTACSIIFKFPYSVNMGTYTSYLLLLMVHLTGSNLDCSLSETNENDDGVAVGMVNTAKGNRKTARVVKEISSDKRQIWSVVVCSHVDRVWKFKDDWACSGNSNKCPCYGGDSGPSWTVHLRSLHWCRIQHPWRFFVFSVLEVLDYLFPWSRNDYLSWYQTMPLSFCFVAYHSLEVRW
jgi:hypothetical protein